ncbi:hypothetical protein [Neptuniibacter sp. QD37_11]|uniref:hypothetical protein n=1 Tax=Neptuniibacter sp. QD37_11 TaxID=3398209 RepID=UPI0039F49FE8
MKALFTQEPNKAVAQALRRTTLIEALAYDEILTRTGERPTNALLSDASRRLNKILSLLELNGLVSKLIEKHNPEGVDALTINLSADGTYGLEFSDYAALKISYELRELDASLTDADFFKIGVHYSEKFKEIKSLLDASKNMGFELSSGTSVVFNHDKGQVTLPSGTGPDSAEVKRWRENLPRVQKINLLVNDAREALLGKKVGMEHELSLS